MSTINFGNIELQGDISHTVTSLTPIDTINYTVAKWGYIQGTLGDQTDLLNALNLKANVADLSTVATTGDYTDLTNKPSLATVATSGNYSDLSNTPSIPYSTSDLINDSNFVSDANYVHTDANYTLGEKGKLASVESGAEENVIENIKVNGVSQSVVSKEVDLTVPTKTSDLTNDSGFITSVPVSSVDGKTGSVTIIPTGGTTGQVLAKASNTDRDVEWVNQSGGGGATEIFWATFNTTTSTEILSAHNNGKMVCCKRTVNGIDHVYTLTNVLVNNNVLYPVLTSVGLDTSSEQPMIYSYIVDGSSWGAFNFGVPTKTSDLTNDSGFITNANDIFWCNYGSTTSAQIESALLDGKLPCVNYEDYYYTLRFRNSSTNHRFVCNYGGKEKSIACQSGTWIPNADLTFLTSAPVTSVNGQTGAVVISNATTSSAGLMSATDKANLDAVVADYSSALTALGV